MKKIIYISLTIFGILLITLLGYVYSKYKAVEKGINDMQITFDDSRNKDHINKDESILFLLLGIGDRPGDPGRADSIILLSVNPQLESMLMISIPRDTKTEIVGKGFEDKINHSYSYGKTEMVKKTVENFIDHSIDYVIQVNMNGMRQLVDTFGGIEVYNKFEFKQADELGKKTYHFNEGLIHLDGERALHYSRMRKSDTRGDLGRNERQRQVVQALISKASSFSTITKINEIIDILGENMKTNVTFNEMKSYAKYVPVWKDFKINSIEIRGEDATINGIYYYLVTDEERQHISNQLKNHLDGIYRIN